MAIVLSIYLLVVFALFGIVAFLIRYYCKKELIDKNRIFYDEDGNHRYYERSLIEKLYFMRKYPDYPLRSLRKLFFRKKNF